jgi:hypothetical protein
MRIESKEEGGHDVLARKSREKGARQRLGESAGYEIRFAM